MLVVSKTPLYLAGIAFRWLMRSFVLVKIFCVTVYVSNFRFLAFS